MSESGGSELRYEKTVLQRESSDCDVSAKLGQVVLVGPADLFDDPVKAKTLE